MHKYWTEKTGSNFNLRECLGLAIKHNHPRMVGYLLHTYSDLKQSDCHFNVMKEMQGSNKTKMVQTLIASGFDLSQQKDGLFCHDQGDIDEASLLVERHLRHNTKNSEQFS